jgi:hypothetical protein
MLRNGPEGYFTEEVQAKRLGTTVRTLRRWRRTGYGPNYVRIGRFVYYAPVAENEFLAKAQQKVELPAPRRRRAA